MRLTKQGVRDLSHLRASPRTNVARLVRSIFCAHTKLEWCCDGVCGHLYCPRCGLNWDANAGM